jgi:hypothetical protein
MLPDRTLPRTHEKFARRAERPDFNGFFLANIELGDEVMKAKTWLLLLTLTTTLAVTGPVAAAHLEAPDGLVCDSAFDNSLNSRWIDRNGASYYAVDVMAEYDVSNDGAMDRTHEFHFGSPESELVLESRDLMGSFVDDRSGRVVDKMPMAATVKVKAAHLGKGHDIGAGHEKARGEGHHKVNGGVRNAEFTECRVVFGAPPPCRAFCR